MILPSRFQFLLLALLLTPALSTIAQDYLVTATTSPTATADASPGDGTCATSDGICTLRAAIEEANATAGLQEVHFDIPTTTDPGCDPTSGLCQLFDGNVLPSITDPLVLDGTTQSGALCTSNEQLPTLALSAAFSIADGLDLTESASGSSILALAISGYNIGIHLQGSSHNTLRCNVLGSDTLGNDRGIVLESVFGTEISSANNLVETNRLTGNAIGIAVAGEDSDNNLIRRNRTFSNTGLGIDLLNADGASGPDLNDGGDDDFGPNQQQNSPVLERATLTGTRLRLWLHVDSDPTHAAYPLDLHVYQADADGEEGEHYLFTNQPRYTATNYSGCGTAPCTVEKSLLTAELAVGDTIVVLAIDQNGNTSEFSAPVMLDGTQVTSTGDDADSNVGDGFCRTASGACTLRAALEETNFRIRPDVIEFDIDATLDGGCNATTGICTIKPSSTLPEIVDQVVIDGSTQPGNEAVCTRAIPDRPAYRIVLDGSNTEVGNGLLLEEGSDGSVIRGLNIGRFEEDGIRIERSSWNQVACSFIGTTSDGLGAAPNGLHGIDLSGHDSSSPGAIRNVIGTNGDGIDDAYEGNLISANGQGGVNLSQYGTVDDNIIAGNYIGTDATGTPRLGQHQGVRVATGGNRIGSDGDGVSDTAERNLIGDNEHGVWVGAGSRSRISQNSTFENTRLGIDLVGGIETNDVTANDEGDGDGGPNRLQNTPVIASSILGYDTLNLTYLVDTDSDNAAYPLEIEVFKADIDGEEGQTYLGTLSYSAAQNEVTQSFTPAVVVSPGDQVVATAIDRDDNTSEFSPSVEVQVDDLTLTASLWLEGPFNGTDLNTALSSHLPETDPYFGTESVASGFFSTSPGADVVDWIWLELRSGEPATSMTVEATTAALLMRDGTVKALDATSLPRLTGLIPDRYWLVVGHRNHLAVMSDSALVCSSDACSHDFRTSQSTAYGSDPMVALDGGGFGLMAGDGNANGQVQNDDKNTVWAAQAGQAGYLGGDFNLNAQVQNDDKNELWNANAGRGTQVPEAASSASSRQLTASTRY